MTRQKAPIAAVGETWIVEHRENRNTTWRFRIVYVERRRGHYFYLAMKLNAYSHRPLIGEENDGLALWFDENGYIAKSEWNDDFMLVCPTIKGRAQYSRYTFAAREHYRSIHPPEPQPELSDDMSDEEFVAELNKYHGR